MTATVSLTLLLASLLAAAPSALAVHKGPNSPCDEHGGDTDGDNICNDVDPDNDNDGAPDKYDPHPNQYSELDYIICLIKLDCLD